MLRPQVEERLGERKHHVHDVVTRAARHAAASASAVPASEAPPARPSFPARTTRWPAAWTASPFTTAPLDRTVATTSAPSPATSPRPSSTANRNRPDSSASRGRAQSAASRARDDPGQVGSPVQPGERRGEHVPHPVMAERRQQPGLEELAGQRARGVRRQPAQLHVAARGQLNAPVAKLAGEPREHPQLLTGDQPARQPDPREEPVGRLGEPQHARAAVGPGAAGSGAGLGHARIVFQRPATTRPGAKPRRTRAPNAMPDFGGRLTGFCARGYRRHCVTAQGSW